MHAGLVVSATDLFYHYRKTTALNGISLAIPRGQLCGFIGPDGVGKSTLLSLIAGARAVQRGQRHHHPAGPAGSHQALRAGYAGFLAAIST